MARGRKRPGAGRPLGSKDLRPHNSILEVEQAHAGLIPVKFEGDSLEFLRDTFRGKIWPSREQIYAAKSVLPIEYPPAVTLDGRNIDEIKADAIREYREAREAEAENYREEYAKWLDAVVLACAHETACRLLGKQSKWGSPAGVVEAVEKALAQYREKGELTNIAEIVPAERKPVVVRKRESQMMGVASVRPPGGLLRQRDRQLR